MKTSGIVFDMARLFTQPVVTDALVDRSRYHNNGTAYNISAWEQLPSGLYCPKMVSASSGYYLVPDIAPLLGAKQATWMAWVRKDAYVQYQTVASDFQVIVGFERWDFGDESSENLYKAVVGDGTNVAYTSTAGLTSGWHFVWMKYVGGSATGLEAGIDNVVCTPVATVTVTALGVEVKNQTYIGRNRFSRYSSMTLATLRIHNVALSDSDIWKYRESTRRLIGI
jgi:hypothetical protein